MPNKIPLDDLLPGLLVLVTIVALYWLAKWWSERDTR